MERRIIRTLDGNRTDRPVTRDILQSSIFGFMLLNVFYDDILIMDISEEVKLISLVNDPALLSVSQTSETLVRVVDSIMDAIDAWKCNYRLQLVWHKVESIMLTKEQDPGIRCSFLRSRSSLLMPYLQRTYFQNIVEQDVSGSAFLRMVHIYPRSFRIKKSKAESMIHD